MHTLTILTRTLTEKIHQYQTEREALAEYNRQRYRADFYMARLAYPDGSDTILVGQACKDETDEVRRGIYYLHKQIIRRGNVIE